MWALDHSHRSGSFKQKARKGIFVGISANRKGWIIFDPKTRKCYTTFHASFDESLDGRRCALRDFDLRECKAGAGATRDEERLAKLERKLYEEEVDLPFEDTSERFLGNDRPPSGGAECRGAGDENDDDDDDDDEEEENETNPSAQQTRRQRQSQESRSGGSACLLYTSPSPRDGLLSRMPSAA